jgi:hypothetical protein
VAIPLFALYTTRELILFSATPAGQYYIFMTPFFRQDKIEHILVRHEQAATHAADGYARATGKAGSGASDLWTGRYQCGHRHSDRVHGFHPQWLLFLAKWKAV